MLSPAPSIDDFYAVFQSHLLGEVLGLPRDSPPMKALVDGVGIEFLNDFLLQPGWKYHSYGAPSHLCGPPYGVLLVVRLLCPRYKYAPLWALDPDYQG